jgi:histidinol phosphatase-like PHP family hydrolase
MAKPKPRSPRYDFHAHTYLTDGQTSATDMWVAGERLGHTVMAITDHIAMEDPEPLLKHLHQEARAWEGEPMRTLVGVEITKAPPRKLGELARAARNAGAEIVIVHGESIVEEVPEGTNHAALECGEVDILAHPGLLTLKDAELAKANGTILEVSGRRGHCLTNGHVVRMAISVGAELVVDSDAHSPEQLLSREKAERIAAGAGLEPARVLAALEDAPQRLLSRVGKR